MDRLDALHAFVRLFELGSFTAVADELRVSQSTVSKWIARLEEQLGTRLIERTSRTRRVTDAGDLLYRRAREILATYAATEAELQAGDVLGGRLRVSAPVVFGQRHLLPLVPDFMTAHPRVELDLVLDDRYARLIEDGFDVLLRVGTPVDSALRSRTLARGARHLVASPRFVERWGMPVEPAELAARPALLHTGADVWRLRSADAADDWHRVRVQARFTANSSEALRVMALAGQGMAILADWLVAEDLGAGRLVALLPDFELPGAPIQALMPSGGVVHPRVRAFVDHLAERLELPGPAR